MALLIFLSTFTAPLPTSLSVFYVFSYSYGIETDVFGGLAHLHVVAFMEHQNFI